MACGARGNLESVKFLVENNIETDIHKSPAYSEHDNKIYEKELALSPTYSYEAHEYISHPRYPHETPIALAIAYRHHNILQYFKEKFGIDRISIDEVNTIIDIEISNFRPKISKRVGSVR